MIAGQGNIQTGTFWGVINVSLCAYVAQLGSEIVDSTWSHINITHHCTSSHIIAYYRTSSHIIVHYRTSSHIIAHHCTSTIWGSDDFSWHTDKQTLHHDIYIITIITIITIIARSSAELLDSSCVLPSLPWWEGTNRTGRYQVDINISNNWTSLELISQITEYFKSQYLKCEMIDFVLKTEYLKTWTFWESCTQIWQCSSWDRRWPHPYLRRRGESTTHVSV